MRPKARLAALLGAALITAVVAAPTLARTGDVSKAGSCSIHSDWTLKAGHRDGRIEVEFEVDQNRSGVPWKVTLRRNGHRVASLTAITQRPSGSFEIRRVIARQPNANRITAIASRASGETCRAAGTAPKAAAATAVSDDPAGHDAGDDHGRYAGADL